MTTTASLRQNRNLKHVVAVLTLSAAAFFPGAASAHASAPIGTTGSVQVNAYSAYGLAGPVTLSPATSLSAVYAAYGLQGPVILSPASGSATIYLAYGMEGPVESTGATA